MRILARLQPPDVILVLFDRDRAARRAAGADALVLLEEPHALLIEEVLIAQRTDRAQVDNVAREFVVQGKARQNIDLFVAAAVDDHQLARAADLAAEAHAARAHHATVDEQGDGIPHVAAAAGERADVGAALVLPMLEVIILQTAFACLVADRAVDRMIDQQVFFDHRPGFAHILAIGDEDRAVLGRRLAGRHQLRHHRDGAGIGVARATFDQAHAATRHDRQPGMPAVVRNLDAGALGSLDAVEALLVADFDFAAIYEDDTHGRNDECRVMSDEYMRAGCPSRVCFVSLRLHEDYKCQ